MGIKEVAANKGGVVVVRIGLAVFVGTVKRSAGVSLGALLI